METSQVNITLGTAGHIDHGKTAIVKSLTGCDTDFLREEKQRGMSIELGFAPCVVSNRQVGIVDVPGHENFIKTMVAGASGMDGVILVIAADDGVMPQTREHLDILTLLGIGHGIIALTKIDAVEKQRIESAGDEIRVFVKGTFLENAPVLPVSNITGEGFGEFVEALKELVGAIKPKSTDGIFRLPVEKVFSIKGYGSVVTGIPVSGTAKLGDELVILPQNSKGRVRAIQVYNKESDKVISGQCAALNIPQWDHKTIKRGDVVTIDGCFEPAFWYIAQLELIEQQVPGLKTGTKVRLHTGTSETVATAYLLEGNTAFSGRSCLVQFHLAHPVTAAPRDRFIIRFLSPPATIGGGVIIEQTAGKIRRTQAGLLDDVRNRSMAVMCDKDFVGYCVKSAVDKAASAAQVGWRVKLMPDAVAALLKRLADEGKIIELAKDLYAHAAIVEQLTGQLLKIVSDFHNERPQSPGIEDEKLLVECGLEKKVFGSLVAGLLKDGKLSRRKGLLALTDHRESFEPEQAELLCRIEAVFRQRLFNPPDTAETAEILHISAEDVRKTLVILLQQQSIAEVERGMFFHTLAIEQAKQRLVEFIGKEGQLESVKFKYLLDTTRKYAIPLLDYMDKIGVTRRVGNTRYLKNSSTSV